MTSNAQYCEGGPSNDTDSNIDAITMNGASGTSINFTGSCPGITGVEDQTGTTVDLVIGQEYSIDVTFGTCGGGWDGAGEVWVDYDQDELFDAAESIGQSSGNPDDAPWDSPVTFTFTVPQTATVGTTRMRIVQEEGGTNPLDPCAAFSWGSVIDFTVNVIAQPATPPTPDQDPAAPSCATGSDLTLAGTPPAGIEWYWQGTDEFGTSTADDGTAPYTVFTNGTYYARAYDSALDAWSEASSITVSNFVLPSDPPAPVADEDPACEVTGGTNITVDAAPTGIEYYWQGTDETGTSQADAATAAYPVTTSGTYYVAAYDPATECWSDASSVTVSMSDIVPNDPIVTNDNVSACSGDASITLEASEAPTEQVTYTIEGEDSFGDGWNGASVEIFADGVSVLVFDVPSGSSNSETFDVLEGATITTQWTAGDFDAECSYEILDDNSTVVASSSGGSEITSFTAPMSTYDLNWYDAATGGNLLGSGNTLEAVGTSVMPTATNGTYEFYVEQSNGCTSNRSLVTVNVSDVNIEAEGIAATCNGSATGSFVLTDTLCGVTPFSYSVDGGAYETAIPTDLTVGSHTLVVQDDNGDESAELTFTVNDAPEPSDLEMNDITDEGGQVSWNGNGDETEWNVEWGEAGYTPGTGAEIGSSVVSDTFEIITGLDANEDYDIYVSANCGGGATPNDSSMISFTTDCGVYEAVGFCESFDSDSPTQICWTVLDENGDGDAWDLDYSFNTNSGDEVAAMYTDINSGDNDDWLITPNVALSGNEVMNFFYRVQSDGEPNDFEVLLSTTGTNPADFEDTLMYLASYDNENYLDSTIDLSAYSGDVYIAFHVPSGGLDGWRLYIDDVCFNVCDPEPGTDGSADVCRTDETVNLNSVIVKGEETGSWSFPGNQQLIVDDSLFNVSTLPADDYEVLYIVEGGCSKDTTVATITVFPPSSAGQNGTLNVCQNQPVNLFDGLNGNVDLGGTWYDPSDSPIAGSQPVASSIPGSFNYDYVTSNGVCPADTSLVEVVVDSECDYLSLGEEKLEELTVYPNPATDVINISNPSSSESLKVEILDMNGRVVLTDAKALANATEGSIDISHLVKGMYTLRVFNGDGQKTFKVVKQ